MCGADKQGKYSSVRNLTSSTSSGIREITQTLDISYIGTAEGRHNINKAIQNIVYDVCLLHLSRKGTLTRTWARNFTR
jgi:hypothetical protein